MHVCVNLASKIRRKKNSIKQQRTKQTFQTKREDSELALAASSNSHALLLPNAQKYSTVISTNDGRTWNNKSLGMFVGVFKCSSCPDASLNFRGTRSCLCRRQASLWSTVGGSGRHVPSCSSSVASRRTTASVTFAFPSLPSFHTPSGSCSGFTFTPFAAHSFFDLFLLILSVPHFVIRSDPASLPRFKRARWGLTKARMAWKCSRSSTAR